MELDVYVSGVTIDYEDIGKSRYFPTGHDGFYKVSDLIKSGKYETGSIDELTKYVMVSKEVILTLVNSLYCNLDHINKRLDTLKAVIEKLPDGELYQLVQTEF